MNLRKATVQDSELLSRLNLDVQQVHAEHYPAVFKAPQDEAFAVPFFSSLLQDPEIHIFIVEEGGEGQGYIVCREMRRPENAFTYASYYLYIDAIGVRPAAQGRGLGAALISRARSLAEELGAERLALDSWDFNASAHGFFEHQGFTRLIYRYWRGIDEQH